MSFFHAAPTETLMSSSNRTFHFGMEHLNPSYAQPPSFPVDRMSKALNWATRDCCEGNSTGQ